MNKGIELSKELSLIFDKKSVELSQLDLKDGFGNYGFIISRSFSLCYDEILKNPESALLSTIFKTMSYSLVSSTGGIISEVFSEFFNQSAIALNGSNQLSGPVLNEIINNTVNALSIKYEGEAIIESFSRANEKAKHSIGNLNSVLSALVEGAYEVCNSNNYNLDENSTLDYFDKNYVNLQNMSAFLFMTTLQKVFSKKVYKKL